MCPYSSSTYDCTTISSAYLFNFHTHQIFVNTLRPAQTPLAPLESLLSVRLDCTLKENFCRGHPIKKIASIFLEYRTSIISLICIFRLFHKMSKKLRIKETAIWDASPPSPFLSNGQLSREPPLSSCYSRIRLGKREGVAMLLYTVFPLDEKWREPRGGTATNEAPWKPLVKLISYITWLRKR